MASDQRGDGRERIRVLETYLSVERLEPYRAAVGGDLAAAEELYQANLAASGAFYEELAAFEVVFRNALAHQLARWHGRRPGHWYDDPHRLLSDRSRDDIQAARARVERLGRPETPGRVVAELSFGFWRFLLARQYEKSLWTPHLRHAFPGLRPQARRSVYDRASRLNHLRNRIAHHEPIHRRDLAQDHQDLVEVARWINPTVATWIEDLSRVASVLDSAGQLVR